MSSQNKRTLHLQFQLSPESGNGELELPERELSRAVLLQALQDFMGKGERKRKAYEFFVSPESEHLFSFKVICRNFGIDPEAAREAILSEKFLKPMRRRNRFRSELKEAA